MLVQYCRCGGLDGDDFRLHLRRQIVVANQNIVQPVRMVLARPAFHVHLAHFGDGVAQALQPAVDVDDFVEVFCTRVSSV